MRTFRFWHHPAALATGHPVRLPGYFQPLIPAAVKARTAGTATSFRRPIMITVAVANRTLNTGASTTTPGIVDHMAQIGKTVHCLTSTCCGQSGYEATVRDPSLPRLPEAGRYRQVRSSADEHRYRDQQGSRGLQHMRQTAFFTNPSQTRFERSAAKLKDVLMTRKRTFVTDARQGK